MHTNYKDFSELDRTTYNHFYKKLGDAYSDYCYSVVRTWLCVESPVQYVALNDNCILLKYQDVLDTGSRATFYAPIGDELTHDNISLLLMLACDRSSKVIVADNIYRKYENNFGNVTNDPGLNDYIYSVPDYVSLRDPAYRRIRQSISVFKRDYKTELEVFELELADTGASFLINSHHTWDQTYRYHNDPFRHEGGVMSNILNIATDLKLHCLAVTVNNVLEGFYLYTYVDTPIGMYANIHHARFSYLHRYANDYSFHLLAQHLIGDKIDFINMERDSNIAGLRHHKELMKPVKRLYVHILNPLNKQDTNTEKLGASLEINKT